MTEELGFGDEDAVLVGYVTDLYELLRAIDEVMPKDATLSLEGRPVPEVERFLEEHRSPNTRGVEAGTLWPEQRFFQLPLSGNHLTELRLLAERHAEPEIADHLVVYRDREILLTAYDAGNGEVFLAPTLPQSTIENFRAAVRGALRDR